MAYLPSYSEQVLFVIGRGQNLFGRRLVITATATSALTLVSSGPGSLPMPHRARGLRQSGQSSDRWTVVDLMGAVEPIVPGDCCGQAQRAIYGGPQVFWGLWVGDGVSTDAV